MAKNVRKKDKKIETRTIQATKDFRTVYAVGALGGFNQYDLRLFFYDKQLPGKESETVYNSPLELALPPSAAKELATWLNRQIEAYEKTFGEIVPMDVNKISKYLAATDKIKKMEDQKLKEESSGSKPS